MREKFPHKKPGDNLPSSHINRLGRTVERLGRGRSGTNTRGKHGGSFTSNPQSPPFDLTNLVISNLKIDDNDSETNGLYRARIRNYSYEGYSHPSLGTQNWFTDDTEEWLVDARDSYLRFEVDSADPPILSHRITAYWDEQRGAFIPISRIWPPQERKVVISQSGGITAGSFGTAVVWENGAPTFPAQTITKLYFNWMAAGIAEEDAEAMARWMDDEQKWVIVELECSP